MKNYFLVELEVWLCLYGLFELGFMCFLCLIEVFGLVFFVFVVLVGVWCILGVFVEVVVVWCSLVVWEVVGEVLCWLEGLCRYLLMWDDLGYLVLFVEVVDVLLLLYVEGVLEILEWL